eukprot:9467789-Pyramimonas_sp.AAC.1
MSSQVKGPWNAEICSLKCPSKLGILGRKEDDQLHKLILKHGAKNWSLIAQGIPGRSGKSCRLRWCNQLNPHVNKEPFSELEDARIIKVYETSFDDVRLTKPVGWILAPQAHEENGNKWAIIARALPGR